MQLVKFVKVPINMAYRHKIREEDKIFCFKILMATKY